MPSGRLSASLARHHGDSSRAFATAETTSNSSPCRGRITKAKPVLPSKRWASSKRPVFAGRLFAQPSKLFLSTRWIGSGLLAAVGDEQGSEVGHAAALAPSARKSAVSTQRKKEAPGEPGASLFIFASLAAVDVDVADVTAIIDVAPERQVGLVGISDRAISADAIRAIIIVGHAPAARETTHSNRASVRVDARHAENAASGRVRAENRTENALGADPIVEAGLHRGGALLGGKFWPSVPIRLNSTGAIVKSSSGGALDPRADLIGVGRVKHHF